MSAIHVGGRYLFTPNENSGGFFTPSQVTVEIIRERPNMRTQYKVKGEAGTTWWAEEDELDEHPSVGFEAWKAKQGSLLPDRNAPAVMIALTAGIDDTDRLEYLIGEDVLLNLNEHDKWRVEVNGKPVNDAWHDTFRDALDAGIKGAEK